VGDRTKIVVAGFILAIAIAVWVGSFAAMIAFYYKQEDFRITKLKPASEHKAEVYTNLTELSYDLQDLKDVKFAPDWLGIDKSLPDVVTALDAKLEEMKNSLENEKRDVETYKNEADEKLRPFEEALQQFISTRDDFKTKVSESREARKVNAESRQTEVSDERGRIEGFDREIRDLITRVAEMDEEHRNKRNQLVAEYEKYRKLFEQLQSKNMKEEFGTDEVDAKVLLVNLQENFVMLDLGKRDRVRKGMRFNVVGLIKGVLPIDKGEVEVREVFREVCYARILSMKDKENPIVAGDGAMNKIYSRNEKLVFVLVGRLAGFNRGEFIRFVEERGDIVANKIDINTDYLIVGTGVEGNEEEQKMIDLARELGIKIITESFFLKLVDVE
jgi:NAD-dependent DNA ligase